MKILLISLLLAARLSAQTPALMLPDFNFYTSSKTLFGNKDLEPGKILFFVFFDPDCEHCQHAMMNLNEHYQEYAKAAIYLISLDDHEKMKRFVNKYAPNLNGKKNVTLLQDSKNEFIGKFMPRKYPSMFLYSPQKKLLDYEDNPESMFRFSKQINAPVK